MAESTTPAIPSKRDLRKAAKQARKEAAQGDEKHFVTAAYPHLAAGEGAGAGPGRKAVSFLCS